VRCADGESAFGFDFLRDVRYGDHAGSAVTTTGPPYTDILPLLSFSGTYAQLQSAFPAPAIWVGAKVFTTDQGWCLWLATQGWIPYSWWLGGPQVIWRFG
jgi:hypothetical protein